MTTKHALQVFIAFSAAVLLSYSSGISRAEDPATAEEETPLSADFTVCPASPAQGETVDFFASSASISDGGTITCTWSFGDGSPAVTTDDPAASHVFAAAGMYIATLSISSGGNFAQERKAVIVGPVDPTPGAPLTVPTLSHGPLLGNVTPNGATVWVRTSDAATVVVQYGLASGPLDQTVSATTRCISDFTAHLRFAGLLPKTHYSYQVSVDGSALPQTYSFKTAPPVGSAEPFTFTVFSDFFTMRRVPGLYTALVFQPAFMIFLGDLSHWTPGSLEGKRRMLRRLRGPETPLGSDFKATVIDHQIPLYHIWDDHDYGRDNSSMRYPRRALSLQTFSEYFPMPDDNGAPKGIWQYYRYSNADFFMIDNRGSRDPSREHRSMLGPVQETWLKHRLLRSTARWKFLVTSVPFNRTSKPRDGWQAYMAERTELVDFIEANRIAGVVIISGDIHSGGAIDNGTNSDFPELSVPFANPGFVPATGQGIWSEGLIPGAGHAGFGLLEVSEDAVDMYAIGYDASVRLHYTVTQ